MSYPFKWGLNGRFFKQNWRSAATEIEFTHSVNLSALQFRGHDSGLTAAYLGDSFEHLRSLMRERQIEPVMELLIVVDTNGRSPTGDTPLDILRHNLPAIIGLGCTCVHWHLVPSAAWSLPVTAAVEQALQPQLAAAVALGQAHGFLFGLEHNIEENIHLFSTPQKIEQALTAVPQLKFVYDINHPSPHQVEAYAQLAAHVSMLHVADTCWPQVNQHLPLGQGNLDLSAIFAPLLAAEFNGPAILEIGGTPWSGGFGRDSDAAIRESARILQALPLPASPPALC